MFLQSESKEKEIFKTENLFYCSQNTLVTQKKIIKQKNQSLKKLTELHLELHHKKLKKLHENVRRILVVKFQNNEQQGSENCGPRAFFNLNKMRTAKKNLQFFGFEKKKCSMEI